MAERRMFSMKIIDSDAFIEMPMSARLLYYDLSMRADDDGFINSPKKIMRMVGASSDDMNILIARKFIIPFESGIVVIKHWKIHNYIQADRYKETSYKEEKAALKLDSNKAYTLTSKAELLDTKNDVKTECIQDVSNLDTQVRLELGKDSIELNKKEKINKKEKSSTFPKITLGKYKHVKLTAEEINKLSEEYGAVDYSDAVDFLDCYIEEKGYKANSHYLSIRRWVMDAIRKKRNESKGPRVAKEPTYTSSNNVDVPDDLINKYFGEK